MDYPDDTYTDDEEWKDNYLEEQRDLWEEQGGSYPSTSKPESLFSLFKNVWRTSDSSKVANLDKQELGDLGISVRDCQRISNLAVMLHHEKFGNYFKGLGEITLATSMSKKGWFVELFVTSKKFAHKGIVGSSSPTGKQWRIFGKEKQQEERQEEA